MPASDLLSDAYFGPQAAYVPTGFGDVYDDTFDETLRTRQPTGYLVSVSEQGRAFAERNDLIKQRFGRDIVQEVRQEFPEAGADFLISEYQKRTDQLIEDGRTQNMEAWRGIRKAEEIEAGTVDKAQVAKIEAERTMMRAESDFARYGGSLAGGVTAAFLDPVNIATLPIGAGAGMGILRAALLDGALNMGVEAAEAPFNADWQNQLGFKYGLGEAAADITTAGAGGTALSALIRGGARGLGKLTGRSESVLRGIAEDKANAGDVREAAQYMERVAHIDENLPAARAGDEVNAHEVLAAHRANLQETQDAFRSYRDPAYSEDIPFDVPAGVDVAPSPPAARVFEEGQASRSQFTAYTRPTPQELRYMDGVVAELEQAEKGSLILRDTEGQGSTRQVVTGQENTFPQWFRDMNSEGEGLSRGYVRKVFEKIKEEKPLGKREIRVAKALFEEARGRREENARQILNFRDERAEGLRLENEAGIDALAAREAAADMADPYLEPMPAAADRLAADIRESAENEFMDAARADFERLFADEPDFAVVMEDGSVRSLSELANEMADDSTVLDAVTMCGVG